MTATSMLNGLRTVWIALVAAGTLAVALGWPHTVTCTDTDPICDGSSGSWWAVGAGGAIILVGAGFFVVWAVAIGSRLARRLEQERTSAVDA